MIKLVVNYTGRRLRVKKPVVLEDLLRTINLNVVATHGGIQFLLY